jgi:hypothetical protein
MQPSTITSLLSLTENRVHCGTPPTTGEEYGRRGLEKEAGEDKGVGTQEANGEPVTGTAWFTGNPYFPREEDHPF